MTNQYYKDVLNKGIDKLKIMTIIMFVKHSPPRLKPKPFSQEETMQLELPIPHSLPFYIYHLILIVLFAFFGICALRGGEK